MSTDNILQQKSQRKSSAPSPGLVYLNKMSVWINMTKLNSQGIVCSVKLHWYFPFADEYGLICVAFSFLTQYLLHTLANCICNFIDSVTPICHFDLPLFWSQFSNNYAWDTVWNIKYFRISMLPSCYIFQYEAEQKKPDGLHHGYTAGDLIKSLSLSLHEERHIHYSLVFDIWGSKSSQQRR